MTSMQGRWAGWALGLSLALHGGAAMAAAQAGNAGEGGRSIASAQEFLRQVLPGTRYVSSVMNGMLRKAEREGLRGRFEPWPAVVDADPVQECRSFLLADLTATLFVVRDPATGEEVASDLAAMLGDGLVGSPDGFDFGSVRAVRRQGSVLYLRFAGADDDAMLKLEAEEIASRAASAFDYLRQHCDASAATGF